jgi:hypothetical protein
LVTSTFESLTIDDPDEACATIADEVDDPDQKTTPPC